MSDIQPRTLLDVRLSGFASQTSVDEAAPMGDEWVCADSHGQGSPDRPFELSR
jgi:hypothetical protein